MMRRFIDNIIGKPKPTIVKQFESAIKNQPLSDFNPITILEIGSLDGQDAKALADHFGVKSSEVYVVEPNPSSATKIRKQFPGFSTWQVAISDKVGRMHFQSITGEHAGISSLLERNDAFYDDKAERIEVPVMTGEMLLSILDIEIGVCKIDVEGLTWEVLTSLNDKIDRIWCLHIEAEHRSVWRSQKLYNEVADLLTAKGYIQILFEKVQGDDVQSDSIWIQNRFILE